MKAYSSHLLFSSIRNSLSSRRCIWKPASICCCRHSVGLLPTDLLPPPVAQPTVVATLAALLTWPKRCFLDRRFHFLSLPLSSYTISWQGKSNLHRRDVVGNHLFNNSPQFSFLFTFTFVILLTHRCSIPVRMRGASAREICISHSCRCACASPVRGR